MVLTCTCADIKCSAVYYELDTGMNALHNRSCRFLLLCVFCCRAFTSARLRCLPIPHLFYGIFFLWFTFAMIELGTSSVCKRAHFLFSSSRNWSRWMLCVSEWREYAERTQTDRECPTWPPYWKCSQGTHDNALFLFASQPWCYFRLSFLSSTLGAGITSSIPRNDTNLADEEIYSSFFQP